MDAFGVVLVAGATGGVGRRIVRQLRERGIPVRALVRQTRSHAWVEAWAKWGG